MNNPSQTGNVPQSARRGTQAGNDIILLKQGEIILKGQNRREFENRLIGNVKRRMAAFGEFRVYALQSTVYVEPADAHSVDLDAALEAAGCIFGVLSVTRALACKKDKDAIVDAAAFYLGDELRAARSFKVESKRADKRFPMSSVTLSQYVGGELHDRFPHLVPDMHTPETVVNVEIRDRAAYVHGTPLRGAGGLPVGTGGRMAALLSGGIDSPAAMYLMAKRGVQLVPIHFYSPPYTSVQAKDKVIKLAGILEKYCGRLRVEIVHFTHIQEEIRKKCPEPLTTIITRRFMVRIAERIARYHGCNALVTGDNLGQVASQTADALAVCEQCAELPVFRPLLAFDKEEITTLARRIGTFETSILPYDDCCVVFTPQRPRTRPKLQEVEAAEALLDVEGLVEEVESHFGAQPR